MFIKKIGLAALLLSALISHSTAQKIQVFETGKAVSIRGLSVVDNKIAWLSSSNGYTAISKDGGLTWKWQQVRGFENADFRDIEAFSDKEAIIMSSGTPALILKTTNGGENWQVKYRNDDKAYFFDAMDFSNPQHGLVLGDPINKKFMLMETKDGGESWHQVQNLPDAEDGEAAFAASGTCLRIDKNGIVSFVTGGKVARCISADADYKEWFDIYLPIAQGKESQGAFSLASSGFLFVGGDYSNPRDTESTGVYYDIMRVSISNGYRRGSIPSGYQSCVEDIADNLCLSTGTTGSNITRNSGRTWSNIDATSFNVCRKAKNGNLVLLAGDKGKTGIFKF